MHYSTRLSLLVVQSMAALTAQVAGDVIPLKNWAAPLYWQPAEPEDRADTRGIAGRPAVAGNTPHIVATPTSLLFVAITPCRIVDTRAGHGFTGMFGPPGLTSGVIRNFPIQSSPTCTIPATAQAYSFNVTVVPPGPLGYLILWPQGQTQPNAVTLDDITGDIRNNAAIVPAGTPNGGISAVANGNTDLVIDINGYYIAQSVPQYGYVYNTSTQSVAVGNDLTFDTNGVLTSGIAHTPGTSQITVSAPGDYKVLFSVTGGFTNQFALTLNGTAVSGGRYGASGAPAPSYTGMVIVSLAAGDVLTLRNDNSGTTVPLQIMTGGTGLTVNASIAIQKLN